MRGWNEEDQVRFFTGEAAALVAAQLTARATACLLELHHRPGAGVSGVFEVTDGHEQRFLVATTENVDGPGVQHASSPHGNLRVWEHPHDPRLPGLGLASIPAAVEATWGGGARLTGLETVTYRPLRRAVMRATFDGGRDQLFLKVLRRDAGLLKRRHLALSLAGVPVPGVVEPVLDEVVALTTVKGIPLAQAYIESDRIPLAPDRVTGLLESLPVELIHFPAREAWTDRIPDYASAARTALPSQGVRIDEVVALILDVTAAEPRGPLVVTHGDLYEANLFVSDGEISGVVDVDAVGPGYVVDDLACFLAHLAVLRTIDEAYGPTVSYLPRYLDAFGNYVETHGSSRANLLARTAAVIVTLIAGTRAEGGSDWEATATRRLRMAEGLAAQATTQTQPWGRSSG